MWCTCVVMRVIKWYKFYMEQYILSWLLCDLFSKNWETYTTYDVLICVVIWWMCIVYVCVFSFDVLSSDVCMCVAFVVTSYCVHCTRKYFCLQNWRFILVLAMLGMWCFPISDYQFSRTFVVKILYRNISIYGCFRGWHFITVRLAYTQIHFLFLVNQPKSDCIHHFLIPSEHANT